MRNREMNPFKLLWRRACVYSRMSLREVLTYRRYRDTGSWLDFEAYRDAMFDASSGYRRHPDRA